MKLTAALLFALSQGTPPAPAEPPHRYFAITVGAAGDLDRDGTPDLLIGDPGAYREPKRPFVWAISGKDGHVLRRFEPPPGGGYNFRLIGGADLDADATPDLLVGRPAGSQTSRGALLAFSGASARLLDPLDLTDEHYGQGNSLRFLSDLDKDGVAEVGVLASAQDSDGVELRLLSGASWEPLRAIRVPGGCDQGSDGFTEVPDLDGDGLPECALAVLSRGECQASVTLCQGKDGGVLWTYRATLPGRDAPGAIVFLADRSQASPGRIAASSRNHVDVLDVRSGELLRTIRQFGADKNAVGFGRALATPGDVDGDGLDDLAVAHPEHGLSDGLITLYSTRTGRERWNAYGDDRDGHRLGHQLVAIGDVSGDGLADLVAGSDAGQAGGDGAAFVLSGRTGKVLFEFRRRGDDVVVQVRSEDEPKRER